LLNLAPTGKEVSGNVTMICITRGVYQGVMVMPRWPSAKILIDPVAFDRLKAVQAELAGDAGSRAVVTHAEQNR